MNSRKSQTHKKTKNLYITTGIIILFFTVFLVVTAKTTNTKAPLRPCSHITTVSMVSTPQKTKTSTVLISEKVQTLKVSTQTHSMTPTAPPGSTLLYKQPRTPSEICLGDIVYFETGGEPIFHRVIRITQEGFITKGDDNKQQDPEPVSYANIRGIIIGVIYT